MTTDPLHLLPAFALDDWHLIADALDALDPDDIVQEVRARELSLLLREALWHADVS